MEFKFTFNRKKSFIVVSKVSEFLSLIIDDKEYEITIKRKKNHRSLNANAYFWVLLDKIANRGNVSKIEIYRTYIKNIGGNNEMVCVKNNAVDKLISGWEHNGLGWATDTLESKIDGCTNVILYYGSSTYDTKQMAKLTDMAIQDCKALEIETDTPEQIALRVEKWGEQN